MPGDSSTSTDAQGLRVEAASGASRIETANAGRPLRVCVVAVVAHGIGGMQRHTQDLVRGLVAAGHEVEVICPAARELLPGLHGATWHLVETVGRADPRWRAKFRAAYLEAAARRPFDVVHSESTAALGLMGVPGLPPVVVNYHGNFLGLAKAHVRRMVTRPRTAFREARTLVQVTRLHLAHGNAWAFRNCVSIVPSRQQLNDTRHSHFVPRALMHVVPNGIDPDAFGPRDRTAVRAELGLPKGEIVVSVGRLAKDKGFDVAVAGFAPVARDHPGAQLIVIGDGEERDALQQLVRELGMEGRVDFAGSKPADLVASYLAAGDVFLFPTLRDEAAPLVLPEAMATGLPVIASRLGGITEVLETPGGDSFGILVAPNDASAVERALRRLLSDPSERARLGELALRRFRDQYTLDRMIERTIDVYRTAVARSRRT